MQQIAAGIEVATSRYWQTNAGLIRTEAGIVLVDAGVLPSELAALARACGGSPIVAGISTHEHWDHLLWSAALGVDVPRYASSGAVEAATADRLALLRRLEREEAVWGVRWDHDLFGRTVAHDLGALVHEGIPPIRLIALPGHTPGQIGVWIDGADAVFVGDTMSDIDPPALDGDLAAAHGYLGSLDRMSEMVDDARSVVPGHGTPCDAAEAKRRLARDRRYLEVLLATVEDEGASPDVHAVSARVADIVVDGRLDTTGGRQLHIGNVTDLLRAR